MRTLKEQMLEKRNKLLIGFLGAFISCTNYSSDDYYENNNRVRGMSGEICECDSEETLEFTSRMDLSKIDSILIRIRHKDSLEGRLFMLDMKEHANYDYKGLVTSVSTPLKIHKDSVYDIQLFQEHFVLTNLKCTHSVIGTQKLFTLCEWEALLNDSLHVGKNNCRLDTAGYFE